MITYTDNQPIIDMLDQKPFGVFHLIDSVGKVAKDEPKDDKNLMDQIKKNHEKNKFMSFHKIKSHLFMVRHTAKEVAYNSEGFIEKNKDELPANLIVALEPCNRIIMRIFNKKLTDSEVLEEKVANPMEKFLGYKFRQEMQSLMDELLS